MKLLIKLILLAIAIVLASYILPGVDVSYFISTLFFAVLFGMAQNNNPLFT